MSDITTKNAGIPASRPRAPGFPCWGSAPGICAVAFARAWSSRPCGSATGTSTPRKCTTTRSEVGEGLRGSGVKRDEVFVTTKIWPTHFAPREFDRATRECLARLRLAEVDLLLLHWPNQRLPLEETIGVLCKAKRDGLARHVGVSNFTVPQIEDAVRISTEPLVCNQFECHPFLDQSALIAACRKQGMAVVAYSPIARGRVRDNEVLSRIGAAHKKSATQVCLRFLVQQHMVVIPRTSKVERLSENAAIFDFSLSDSEMASIAALART